MYHSVINLLGLTSTLLLTLASGYLIGRTELTYTVHAGEPISIQEDTRPLVSTVVLERVRNGQLVGSVLGSGTRLFLGSDQILPTSTGAFKVPAFPALTNEIVIRIPESMHFVASVRGKKYYAVLSAGGERITPANRVYFATAEEAERAGYVP